MNNIKGIAFYGPKHSGKTTCANFAVEQGYTRISLADPVKNSAVGMLNAWLTGMGEEPFMDRNILDTHKDKYFVPLLQWLGTDWVRKFLARETFWIDSFIENVDRVDGLVVCDDLRFENEAKALSEAGFVIIKVQREESDRVNSLTHAQAGGDVKHASEIELERIQPDLTIHNTGVEVLKLAVDHIILMLSQDESESVYEFAA